MKNTKIISFLVLILLSTSASAGGGGAAGGGATEVTQLLNNARLIEQYAQQVMSYQNQLQQYATMVQNLSANPLGVSLPNLMQLANNSARLLNYGKDIASSMSKVDQNFANAFRSTQAQSFANKFNLWTNTSQDALKAAMLNAGLQREQFADDASSLQALTNNLASSQGNLSALQALGSLNARQIQESMKLRDLISQQQVAQNTYLAAQASKEQAMQTMREAAIAPYTEPIPTVQLGGGLSNWKK